MRGILSPRPAPWVARLALGGELLLFVTIVLMLGSARTLDGTLCAIAGAITLIAFAAFILAILGDRARSGNRPDRAIADRKPDRERRP